MFGVINIYSKSKNWIANSLSNFADHEFALLDMNLSPQKFCVKTLLPQEMVKFLAFMREIAFFCGTNTELAERFNAYAGLNLAVKSLKQMMNRWFKTFWHPSRRSIPSLWNACVGSVSKRSSAPTAASPWRMRCSGRTDEAEKNDHRRDIFLCGNRGTLRELSENPLMNDYYARDIGNKIRYGYREKQKEGLVIKAPFGYWKDRNTGRIRLHPEAAVTVQMIYDCYSKGMGQKEIARKLNGLERKTPRQLHDERCGKVHGEYRWSYQSVKNILSDESYTGLLVNHRTETRGCTVMPVAADEQFRHECFYPVIIDRAEWEQVQAMLKTNARPYRGNTASHRYAGLLTCGDCGTTFVPRIRTWNGSRRVEYLCKSYMHHGKDFCPSHRIRESELDTRVQQYAKKLRNQWREEQAELSRLQRMWELKRPAIDAHIEELQEEVERLEQEIDDILMEMIHGGE